MQVSRARAAYLRAFYLVGLALPWLALMLVVSTASAVLTVAAIVLWGG